jgi:hypothetical protein
METKRLRAIQQPSHVERLLDAYITRGNALPENAYQIRDPEALPLSLRGVVLQAAQEGRVWACWAYGPQIWLFTAEMSLPLSRERGAPVLCINRYGERAELTEASSWVVDPGGQWRRCGE